jgi:hypothetical protein
MKKIVETTKEVVEESIKDPEIITAVSTPAKTVPGIVAKVVYIFWQVVDNVKKVLNKNK